jgi:serine/threonine protein kinase/tetratricopeptide (TPR) repeat protein
MSTPIPAPESQLGDDLLAELVDDFLRRYRAGERPSVDEYAAKHPELAERIRELIPAMMVLEQPAVGPTVAFEPVVERVGTTIGRYKLLERIGEGGFGVVYMAEQQHPVRRKVALKVIKPGMDTRQVVARFEAERQALALMDHENIAKVLDAGATDSGRPYFVMELVKGVPITEFCDANHLTPDERLRLFVPICQAVQHAHNKGIIHRDLKPTNVLVTVHDTRPVVKVIDFGVAKALGQEMTDKTLFTGFAEMIGTPLYMSPEQAGQSGLDVDTRSDIYSLGVLLYELLTGTTPITSERFKKAANDEIRRIICEEEPPKPSTRLSDLSKVALAPPAANSSLASISALRHTEPAKLTKLLRGELDWIVMKALEKDRNRRYETANGFAMDLERYLADEPVQACPPSTVYRLKKFVRRNKGPVLAGAIVLLTLVGGIVGTSIGLMRATQAQQAEAERAEGERQAKERAEANFALANDAVGHYLGAVTDAPEMKQADFTRLRKHLLESALPFYENLAAQKSDDPAVEAAKGHAHFRLAKIRMLLGENEAALQDVESTLAIFARLHKEFPEEPAYRHDLARGHHDRAEILARFEKRTEAEADYRQAIKILEGVIADDPHEAARQNLAESHHDFGHMLILMGRHKEAEAELRRALDYREKLVADFPKHPVNRQKLAESQGMLSAYWDNIGEHEKAKSALDQALEIQERLVDEFPEEMTYADNLAVSLNDLGNLHLQPFEEFDKAAETYRKAIRIQEKLVAAFPTVPGYQQSLANTYGNLGIALQGERKCQESEVAFREALGLREKLAAAFPTLPVHQNLLASGYVSLGNVLVQMGKREEGETAYRAALEIYERFTLNGPDSQDHQIQLGGLYCNFGFLLLESGKPEQAFESLQKAVARLEGVLAKEPRLATAREFLRNCHMERAEALIALGRRSEALKSREQEVALNADLIGPNHFATLTRMYLLTEEYDAAGRSEAALQQRKELLKRRQLALGAEDADALEPMADLTNEMRIWREDVLANLDRVFPHFSQMPTPARNLAKTYVLIGQHKEALALREKILSLRKEQLGPDDPQTLASIYELAESLIACDRGAEAVTLIDDCLQNVEGKTVDPRLIPALFDLRFRHFAEQKDAAACRATAEMWERLNRTDAESLYSAACYRAATAAVLRETDKSAKSDENVAAEADRALNWLSKSVAAGFSDVARIEKDEKLAILRDRDDFQRLIAPLKAQAAGKGSAGGSKK